jgi:hypothetical protein
VTERSATAGADFDRAQYDRYVELGFNPVAAAAACGAPLTFSGGETDPGTGSVTYRVEVEMP